MERKDRWNSLATIKSFDIGISPDSHHESIFQPNTVEIISTGTTTPISLLVQSLVQQLCTLIEKDQVRADRLYKIICEKLYSMNLIDDSYAMGEFEVMRSWYQRALYQLVSVTSGGEAPMVLPDTLPIVQPSGLEWSRYHKEFEELAFVAKGGFGSVFKARHRLDGVEYAVKKVNIRSSDINSIMIHLSEVKTIASLNHPNIVNYKAAWLEPMIESSIKNNHKYHIDISGDSFSKIKSKQSSVFSNMITSFKTHNSKELNKSLNSQSDFVISFEHSNSWESDELTSEEDCDLTTSEEETESPSPEDNGICKWLNTKEYNNCSRVNLKWATLYIQMSFCEQTLKQWLDKRNQLMYTFRNDSTERLQRSDSSDSGCMNSPNSDISLNYPISWTPVDVLLDMFTQLVEGLHYIHSRGIIHHDIKPSNVFVATSEKGMQVQLGDFGLACPLQQSHRGQALGTHLYAAPEQLDGQCNPKSDLYSLGIILLEMIQPFTTDMERMKTIEDLRKEQIPAQLTANYPKVAHIVGKLVQRRPSKRLDTDQLLVELKSLAENKDETIKCLREELAAKNDEIAKLKMMLAKFTYKT